MWPDGNTDTAAYTAAVAEWSFRMRDPLEREAVSMFGQRVLRTEVAPVTGPRDLLTDAPSAVSTKQLDELHVAVK